MIEAGVFKNMDVFGYKIGGSNEKAVVIVRVRNIEVIEVWEYSPNGTICSAPVLTIEKYNKTADEFCNEVIRLNQLQ